MNNPFLILPVMTIPDAMDAKMILYSLIVLGFVLITVSFIIKRVFALNSEEDDSNPRNKMKADIQWLIFYVGIVLILVSFLIIEIKYPQTGI